ncbi:MAG: C39 family peptidase [Massilimicrobiota timonensis]
MKFKGKITKLLVSIFMVLLIIPVINADALDLNDIVTIQLNSLLEDNIEIDNIYPLYDLNNEQVYDMYIYNGGYAIATKNGFISEAMPHSDNPYKNVLNEKKYYFGPYNYFYDNKGIITSIDGKTFPITRSTENIFSEELINANNEVLNSNPMIMTRGDNVWRGTPSSRFTRYKNWENTNNTCGPHAAAVILAYIDDYIDDRIVPSSLRTRNSTSPGSLISFLIANTSNPTATRPRDVSNGMWWVISKQAGLYYAPDSQSIGTTWNKAVQKINGFPNCVGIGLVEIFDSEYGDHWVVGYQYKEDSSNKGYFKCYDGWGHSDATIHASWTLGLVWVNKK